MDVIAAVIIKNNNSYLEIKDGFDFSNEDDNWAIGGPVVLLLESGLGVAIGSFVDIDQDEEHHSILKSVSRNIKPNKSAMIVIIYEDNTEYIDEFLLDFTSDKVIRERYIDVQAEIHEHQDLEKQLAKEAHEKNY